MVKKFVIQNFSWLAVIILVLSMSSSKAATATPVKLGWNAANDVNVRGYALYYGITNQTTRTRRDVGLNLTSTVSNLIAGATYRIYAVSYNANGVESIPSNELAYFATTVTAPSTPAPPPPRVQIARQNNGSMLISYRATPGQVCGVQFAATPNPVAWQTLTNVTANSLSNIIALDTSASQVAKRFYRVAHTAQPLVSAITITRLANGAMRLSWTAPPFSVCRVTYAPYSSSTLWPTLANVVADAEGRASCVDPAAAVVSSRFYRVVMP